MAILNVVGDPGTSGNTDASNKNTFLHSKSSPFFDVDVSDVLSLDIGKLIT